MRSGPAELEPKAGIPPKLAYTTALDSWEVFGDDPQRFRNAAGRGMDRYRGMGFVYHCRPKGRFLIDPADQV